MTVPIYYWQCQSLSKHNSSAICVNHKLHCQLRHSHIFETISPKLKQQFTENRRIQCYIQSIKDFGSIKIEVGKQRRIAKFWSIINFEGGNWKGVLVITMTLHSVFLLGLQMHLNYHALVPSLFIPKDLIYILQSFTVFDHGVNFTNALSNYIF